jgi:hypothetical protein
MRHARSAARPAGKVPRRVVFETLEPRLLLSAVTVGTLADLVDVDADTSSIAALITTPGSDGLLSFREAVIVPTLAPVRIRSPCLRAPSP